MNSLMEVVKRLAVENVYTTVMYDRERETFYADLHFQAKSHGYLYEQHDNSLILEMRYDETRVIDDFKDLMYGFKRALHGRDYGNQNWFDLCEKHGILEKVVETKTTYR